MTETGLENKEKGLYEEENLDLNRQKFVPRPEKITDYVKSYAKNWTRSKIATFKNYLYKKIGLENEYKESLNRSDAIKYKSFKNMVSRALAGDNLGLEVYTVPFEQLAKKNAWGLNDGFRIAIPRMRDVPKMFMGLYKTLSNKIKRQDGKTEQEFNQDVQKYTKLHEILEAVTKPKNHELYEATLLYALKDLANEGNSKAEGVYKGALATYKTRLEAGDSFARDVQIYYKWLNSDVEAIFGSKPCNSIIPAYA